MLRIALTLILVCLIVDANAADNTRFARGPHLLHTTFDEKIATRRIKRRTRLTRNVYKVVSGIRRKMAQQRPLNAHRNTGHCLPPSKSSMELSKLKETFDLV